MVRRALPSLNGLRAFEAFCVTGSMTAAAERLCVTHGAVSRQVRALEAELGVALLQGPKHRLELTDAGQALSRAATGAFDMIAAALPGAGQMREIVLSCYGTLAMKWLIPRLPEFLGENPDLRLRVSESRAPVDFNSVHAAIRFEDDVSPEGARAVPFMAHFHGPVLSPSLHASIGERLEAVLTLPRLYSQSFPEGWARWAKRSGIALPPAALERGFEHNSYMLEAAAAGLGAAISPWAFAADDIARCRLVAPFGFEAKVERYVLLRPRLGDNPAVDRLADWLKRAGKAAPKPPGPITPR